MEKYRERKLALKKEFSTFIRICCFYDIGPGYGAGCWGRALFPIVINVPVFVFPDLILFVCS